MIVDVREAIGDENTEATQMTYISEDFGTAKQSATNLVGQTYSFLVAGLATLAITMNIFVESLHTARLSIVLFTILMFQILQFHRFLFCREFCLYLVFVIYMLVAVIWTPNLTLAPNTLVPALNFLLILVLFGMLATYCDYRSVIAGTVAGFVVGAGMYSVATGFPFVRPSDFSYNAIANMYLFGLFVTLLAACFLRPTRILLLIALIVLLLVVATMSIKTSLGIMLGVAATFLVYFRYAVSVVIRNSLVLFAGIFGFVILIRSNETVLQSLRLGFDRISLGVDILQARQNLPGYSAFDDRITWLTDGLIGWTQSPMFGHGVEAFRNLYGITSHSAPVDLLYNYGLIGFSLFYAVFVSILIRLMRLRDSRYRQLSALVFGTAICYLFISLSSTTHYNAFLAVFIALATAILRKLSFSDLTASVGESNQ